MGISVGQFLAVSSISFVCGVFVVSGVVLSLINHIFSVSDGKRVWLVLWTAALCVCVLTGGLAPIFSFIFLVYGDNPDDGYFFSRAVLFFVFLLLGIFLSLLSAVLLNHAFESGRLNVSRADRLE